VMSSALASTRVLVSFAAAALLSQGCNMDQSDAVSDARMQGTINGKAWVAGPGVVKISTEPNSPYVVRIFEQGTPGDPCSIDRTTGRRVEIGLAAILTGKYEPATDVGYYVETWEGTTGERDAYAAIEIINAPKANGEKMLGKARFGSSGTEDFVEGQFEAVNCEDFP
jgi:hypothetical protein